MSRFCVSACRKCQKRFRLIWRIGGRKISLSQVVRLTCPHCGNSFEQEAVKLVVFDGGAEDFPITFVVEPSCLVASATYDVEPRKE